jgi:hypothetical protein
MTGNVCLKTSGGQSTRGWNHKMTILYPIMIIAGVAATAWGLLAAHRSEAPWWKGILASLTMLAGVIVALLGTLLLVVPDFFQN